MSPDQSILQSALELGQALHDNPNVQSYLKASAQVQADPQLQLMELKLSALFDNLTSRQQAGEVLTQTEVDQFYELENQVLTNPLVAEREACLKALKTDFGEINNLISTQLGVDFQNMSKE